VTGDVNPELRDEENLRLLHLRFIGKIIAGFTHEVKNYLAIIKESAGLIEDLITLGKDTESDSGQYLEIIRSIEEQIEKTNILYRYLNRFAHRMDDQLATFNINESLEELTALVTRFANQNKITIEKDFHESMPSIYSNPSLLQLVVYTALEEKIRHLDKNSKISIQTGIDENSVKIRLVAEGNLIEGEGDATSIPYEILEKIIKQLGGNISEENRKETLLMLPLTAS
jgi:nitrogen-specific signal transduction histidine kinase